MRSSGGEGINKAKEEREREREREPRRVSLYFRAHRGYITIRFDEMLTRRVRADDIAT